MATTTTRAGRTKTGGGQVLAESDRGPSKKRMPERPALRKDLQVKRRKQGTTTYCDVKIPGATSVCTLYDFELALAKKMDGRRDLRALVKEAEALSFRMDVEAIGKFVRQLAAYGFIENADPTPGLGEADEPLGLAARVDAALALEGEDTPTAPPLPPSAADGRPAATGAGLLQGVRARLAALGALSSGTRASLAVRERLGFFTSRAVPIAKRAWENTGPFRVQVVMFVHPAVKRSRIFRDQMQVKFPRIFGWIERNERLLRVGAIALVAVAVLGGLGLAVRSYTIQAHGIPVPASVTGIVDRVLVSEGDRVVEGELLAVVKPAEGAAPTDVRALQQRLDEARGEAKAARRVSTELKRARASLGKRKRAVASAQKALAALAKKKRATARMRAAADKRVSAANAALEKARARVNELEEAQRSLIAAADATVATAEANLAAGAEPVEVRAPSDGEIVSRDVAVGDAVSAEQPLVVVAAASE